MWTPDPDDVASARITEFARVAGARAGRAFDTYADLLAWSVSDVEEFWRCVWDFFDVIAESGSDTVLADDAMPGAMWFPDARLNYVDQVFRDRDPARVAVLERDETGRAHDVTWGQLRAAVASVADLLREHGVGVGDRVVAYLPNGVEAVVAFLATASVGAIWSACGMDYAPSAALGRFAQLEPLVLFAADGYRNGGKVYDRTPAVAEVRAGLPSLRATIAVDRIGSVIIAISPSDELRFADRIATSTFVLAFSSAH